MTAEQFKKNSNLIIDKLEGGYYHPDMLLDGRVNDIRYKTSGETMFGIDRKYLGNPANGTAQQSFWNIIDQANAKKNWKWNYFGGEYEQVLRNFASDIIFSEYQNYSKYLSAEAKKIVDSDDRLIFNFQYAVWNGIGWFKKFADTINEAVKNNIINTDQLVDIVVKRRTSDSNTLISNGGIKISSFIQSLKKNISTNKKKYSFLLIGSFVALLYYIIKK